MSFTHINIMCFSDRLCWFCSLLSMPYMNLFTSFISSVANRYYFSFCEQRKYTIQPTAIIATMYMFLCLVRKSEKKKYEEIFSICEMWIQETSHFPYNKYNKNICIPLIMNVWIFLFFRFFPIHIFTIHIYYSRFEMVSHIFCIYNACECIYFEGSNPYFILL